MEDISPFLWGRWYFGLRFQGQGRSRSCMLYHLHKADSSGSALNVTPADVLVASMAGWSLFLLTFQTEVDGQHWLSNPGLWLTICISYRDRYLWEAFHWFHRQNMATVPRKEFCGISNEMLICNATAHLACRSDSHRCQSFPHPIVPWWKLKNLE